MTHLYHLSCMAIAILVIPSRVSADSVEITIRAFIPTVHPSDPAYIFNIKNASGQSIAVLRSPSPIDRDICYVTDQRGFSMDPNAPARIWSKATLSILDGPARVTSSSADSGMTHAVRCTDGSQFCTDKAGVENLKWGSVSQTGTLVSLPIDAAGSNPCIVPGFVAPSIRYKGQFTIDAASGKLSFRGDVSKFPSIEAFISYEKGSPMMLFQESASGTVMDIGTLRSVQKELSLPIFDGKWTSTDSAGRFSMEITGDIYKFVERSATGMRLERQGTIQTRPDGQRMIFRANDADTLKFLDFSPTIVQQVLARGPQPSFLSFKRTGKTIEATWAGLLVIKDTKGKFKEMKQPGQAPVKTYDFSR